MAAATWGEKPAIGAASGTSAVLAARLTARHAPLLSPHATIFVGSIVSAAAYSSFLLRRNRQISDCLDDALECHFRGQHL